ncbi:MAG: alkane 1-monooxygenase [Paracoccaceae bacterium]
MIAPENVARFRNAAPFWLSMALVPVVVFAAVAGGWALLLPVLATFGVFSLLDAALGPNLDNNSPETSEDQLCWYRLLTLIWFPVQFVLIFGMIGYVAASGHLSWGEKIALFYGVGLLSGAIGIVYAHELMHQKSRLERWLADLLLASVLYSHFRSEHLLVHHVHVATPRDAVKARYNENFHRFFVRVVHQCRRSAFRAERAMLARKNLPWWHARNPFWRYWALKSAFVLLAIIIGGWAGLGLFLFQAVVAIWLLELTNYVEHYGLTRKYLGEGKYEHAQPRHSWNAAHRASNWLLINLQRHSDHHYKPDRRFPLLQNYSEAEAPQLPYGYPVMVVVALIPPMWRRMMNPRVRAWRAMYYPEITDWTAYKAGTLPK